MVHKKFDHNLNSSIIESHSNIVKWCIVKVVINLMMNTFSIQRHYSVELGKYEPVVVIVDVKYLFMTYTTKQSILQQECNYNRRK